MLVVEKASLSRLREDDLETMMHAHWRECSTDHEEVPFDPDWLLGYAMERCGQLACFGLFSDGGLVGYSVFEVSPRLHFKSTRYAFNTGLYVKPECRRGNAGLKLLVESEKYLRAMGVKKIEFTIPNGSALNAILAKSGYASGETYHSKLVN
jgi:predicted GNAT superfamily acetyltransferase